MLRTAATLVFVFSSLLTTWVAGADKLTMEDVFPSDRVLDVQIKVSQKNWDTLRFQSRNFFTALSPKRQFGETESPYTYVDANVTIDGVDFGKVGIRKKGFIGSQSSDRPSLKIKLNYVDKKADIGGLTNLTLNNNLQDTTLMSQFMGYELFNRVGSPAPRCAYAKVTVNGKNLGVYSHVETVREPLLKRGFGNGKGTLYEGTVVDFFEDWEASFENKVGNDKKGREKLVELIKAVEGGEGQNFVSDESLGRAFVPTNDQLGTDWTKIEFDDSSWREGRNGAGFDALEGYQELISPSLNFKNELAEKNTSIYLRLPFDIENASDVPQGGTLELSMKFDDGFIAYLNGERIASYNAPESGAWNSIATRSQRDSEAQKFVLIDISKHRSNLKVGKNVLAIHGMNVGITSSDMLFVAKLESNNYDFEEEIGKVVDLDAFYKFWALEGLLGFWDGYSGNRNNFFVYLNPETDKFHFMPWGADCLFERVGRLGHPKGAPFSVKTGGRVAHLLYQTESGRARYRDELNQLLNQYWDEENLLAEIDRVAAMVKPHLDSSQQRTMKLDRIKGFIKERRAELVEEIAEGMPLWNKAPDKPPVIGDFMGGRGREGGRTRDGSSGRGRGYRPISTYVPIWEAARKGDLQTLKLHLENGVDVNSTDDDGTTALALAAMSGQAETVRFLLEHGADVNRKNDDNATPLHGAAFLGHTSIVELLVKNGADTSLKNDRNQTPLDLVQQDWGEVERIVGFLSERMSFEIDAEEVRLGRNEIREILEKSGKN